jgi:hypothetical protein
MEAKAVFEGCHENINQIQMDDQKLPAARILYIQPLS